MTRYLFICAAVDRPVGGRNVLIWAIEHLRQIGVSAHPVYPFRRYRYEFASTSAPSFFDNRLRRAFSHGFRSALRQYAKYSVRGGDKHAPLSLRPDDVLVIPEFRYPEIASLYGKHRRLLFAQDVFGFARAYSRDIKSGYRMIDGFADVLSTSAASESAVSILSARRSLRLRVPVACHRFEQKKKKTIAYMPRKRREESEIVVAALQQMPEFSDWKFVRIAGISPEALRQTYEEALIFLSFSKQEGFGLPPAEAMSAGCIVIGYTGVGGEEYFDETTGFPIPDGDIISFISTVREVARVYVTDPGPLDQLRRVAATHIASEYSVKSAETTLEAAWRALGEHHKTVSLK